MEEADEAFAQLHRHRGVAQAGRAGDALRLVAGFAAKLFLHLEAAGAGAALLGEQGAEGILLPLSVVGQLPGLQRAEGDGQAGDLGESPFVLLVRLGVNNCVDEFAIITPVPVSRAVGLAAGCLWFAN